MHGLLDRLSLSKLVSPYVAVFCLLVGHGSRGGAAANRSALKRRVVEKLQGFYERFSGVIG